VLACWSAYRHKAGSLAVVLLLTTGELVRGKNIPSFDLEEKKKGKEGKGVETSETKLNFERLTNWMSNNNTHAS